MEEIVRISGVVSDSIVDGSGIRMAIFTQGCTHNCTGCHNPQTHDIEGGYDASAQSLYDIFVKNPLLKGVTFSGGEPFLQAEKLLSLAKEIKALNKDIWIYTGFLFEDLKKDIVKGSSQLLALADVLVDGKFELDRLDLNLWYRGSSNQRIIDVKRSLLSEKPVIIEFEDR